MLKNCQMRSAIPPQADPPLGQRALGYERSTLLPRRLIRSLVRVITNRVVGDRRIGASVGAGEFGFHL